LAYPTGRNQARSELASNDDSTMFLTTTRNMRSVDTSFSAQEPVGLYARADDLASLTSMYNQWYRAFQDANHAMNAASTEMTLQTTYRMSKPAQYSATRYSQAQKEFDRQKKAMDLAKRNADEYHRKIANFKVKRSLADEDEYESL